MNTTLFPFSFQHLDLNRNIRFENSSTSSLISRESDYFSVYFGRQDDRKKELQKRLKEVRTLQYSDPLTIYSPISFFPGMGEEIQRDLHAGESIEQAFEKLDELEILNSKRKRGPFTLKEHMNNYVKASKGLEQLKIQVRELQESIGPLPHPDIKIPGNQDEMDQLVEQFRAYFDNDPGWYEGLRFIRHGGTDFAEAAREAGQRLPESTLDFLISAAKVPSWANGALYHGTSSSDSIKILESGFDTLQGTSQKELGNGLYLTPEFQNAQQYAQNAEEFRGTVLKTVLPAGFRVGELNKNIGRYFENGIAKAVEAFLTQDDPRADADPRMARMLTAECMRRFFIDRGYDAIAKSGATAQLANQQPYVVVFNTKGLHLESALAYGF
jgi:hypothetical protein